MSPNYVKIDQLHQFVSSCLKNVSLNPLNWCFGSASVLLDALPSRFLTDIELVIHHKVITMDSSPVKQVMQ